MNYKLIFTPFTQFDPSPSLPYVQDFD